MAVTTTYSASFFSTVSVSQAAGTQQGPAIVALDNGAAAVFYYNLGTNEIVGRTVGADNVTLGPIVAASTTSVRISTTQSGHIEPVSADRLTNGNIVVTWASTEATSNVYYRIFDSNLNPLTGGVAAEGSGTVSIRPDVAALAGGGFVIAWEKEYSSTDSDIAFRLFDPSGAAIGSNQGISLDVSGNDDTAPSVVGLVDGGFAFGWHRLDNVTTNTTAWHAIRNGDGSQRLGITQFDSAGTINRDLSLSARNDGGYTAFYEDSGWAGAANTEVTAWSFSSAGVSGTVAQGSTLAGANTDLASATSSTGYMVSTASSFTGTQNDGYFALYSASGALLLDDVNFAAAGVDENVSDVAWIAPGRIRIAYERISGTAATGESDTSLDSRLFDIVRNVTGDATDNVLNFQFDELLHILDGLEGNDLLVGGLANDQLFGGNNNDALIGNGGNDYLNGGAGTNELYGGTGDDIFRIEVASNSIIETPGQGTDTVQSVINVFTLPANVENLQSAGAGVFVGVGNGLNNSISSNGNSRDQLFGLSGNDTLNDGGGADGTEDTLLGGIGDDVYVVGVRGSSTIENPGEGTDEVGTTFNLYALQANVENLTFTDSAAHQAGVGNVLGNTIRGNTGVDDLFGREGNDSLHGGTGAANTLLGQEGDDTYNVEAVGDSVIEFAAQGTDTVVTTVANFTLPGNVENLTFVNAIAHIGVGNTLANTLTGGGGADFLNAGDGADVLAGLSGADELTGGAGADQFRYAGNETGVDRIYDFQPGTDKIALLTSGYTPTATRGFVQGAAPVALDPVSTFLYNTATGMVSYDDDGTGAGAAVAFTQLNAGLNLSLGDFLFF